MSVVRGNAVLFRFDRVRWLRFAPSFVFQRGGCPPSSPWLASLRPTLRRDGRLLDRLSAVRKLFDSTSKQAIHVVRGVSLLTRVRIRFPSSSSRMKPLNI